ncbi:hypothetical protein [Kocuria palustris]|uniref:hypothetical protein n=1 Tax=Kocuria palustris TaxID=71999 RepID=UPI0011A81281|nr:hypothetical protein [Kocuria palustris]
MTDGQDGGGSMPQEEVRVLQELLSEQAREVDALAKELAASYKKEIAFFGNLEQRDQAARQAELRWQKKVWWLESEWRRAGESLQEAQTAEKRGLKKIWWLEAEWRRRGDALQAARDELEAAGAQRDAACSERDAARSELDAVRAELETARAQRDALRDSVTGRAQRAYWTARKRLRRQGRAS